MLAYLQPQQQRVRQQKDGKKAGKMVGQTAVTPEKATTEPLPVQNLQDAIKLAAQEIEMEFSKEQLLSPVKSQLNDIQTALSKIAQIADTALEMGVALQENSWAHQMEIQVQKEKYLILPTEPHQNNFKFRGMEEGMEGSSNLICSMDNWLAKALQFENNVFPAITKAFRLDSKKPERQFPRDIIVTFADLHIKSRVQKLAREKNGLPHMDKKVLVFPDISSEALATRKALKPVLQCLQDANINYRWSTPGKLMVIHKNKPYFTWDTYNGEDLLQKLG